MLRDSCPNLPRLVALDRAPHISELPAHPLVLAHGRDVPKQQNLVCYSFEGQQAVMLNANEQGRGLEISGSLMRRSSATKRHDPCCSSQAAFVL